MAKATKKAEEVEVLGTDAESFRKAFTDLYPPHARP